MQNGIHILLQCIIFSSFCIAAVNIKILIDIAPTRRRFIEREIVLVFTHPGNARIPFANEPPPPRERRFILLAQHHSNTVVTRLDALLGLLQQVKFEYVVQLPLYCAFVLFLFLKEIQQNTRPTLHSKTQILEHFLHLPGAATIDAPSHAP